MCSYTQIYLVIIFFIPNYLDASLLRHEEEKAQKYIAKEHTAMFLGEMRGDYGKNWISMPDGNGTARFAVLEENEGNLRGKLILAHWSLEEMPEHVKLFLYTPENREGELLNLENIPNSRFNSSKPTKIISHGWMASSDSSIITSIRDAYLEEQDVNVIGVDWSPVSMDIIYPNAARATKVVGQYIGIIIDNLVETRGASYDDIHIIGHSLGAHVASHAGSTTKQKIARITGLDPALPCFQLTKGPEDRLDKSDANFVDVIHTCAGILGMSILVGHADFYPNGGSPLQPGCPLDNFPTATQACSHSRSHEFFTQSIKLADFRAVRCEDWDHFKQNKCSDTYSLMGEYTSPTATGAFYLKTDASPPFALGINGTIF